MGLTILVVLGIYPLIESFTGTSTKTDPLQEGKAHNIILHIHGAFVPVIVLTLLWRVSVDGLTAPVWLGIVSAGLSTGSSGIVAAHELGHRRLRSWSWWLARIDLFSVLYLHFTVEHNHTHHRHWARPVDPTSSPWGRSIYIHFLRTIPLQIQGAWRARPKDTKRSLLLETLLLIGLVAYNPAIAVAFVVQALVAIYLLEYVNYLQHHGLTRGADGALTQPMPGKVVIAGRVGPCSNSHSTLRITSRRARRISGLIRMMRLHNCPMDTT